MKRILVVVLALASFSGWSQYEFTNFNTVPCGSGGGTVTLPAGWQVYQTTTDTWDGPQELQCINLVPASWNQAVLTLSEAIPGQKIFVKKTFNNPIEANSPFAIDSYTSSQGMLTDCTQPETCSGLRIRLIIPSHPDSLVPTAVDDRFFGFNDPQFWTNLNEGVHNCLLTQHPGPQSIEFMIFEIMPDWEEALQQVTLGSVIIEPGGTEWPGESIEWIYQSNFYDHFQYQSISGTHTYDFLYGSNYSHAYVGYDPANGYPSESNPYYIDVQPDNGTPNPVQQQIAVIFESDDPWYEQFSTQFQPYAFIRGALVEGNDTLRHLLEMHFNETHACGPSLVDMPLEPGNGMCVRNASFEFAEGKCFVLQKDSYLNIKESSALNYGLSGVGMLGLLDGSEINVMRHATGHFGNTWALVDKNPNPDHHGHTEVYLHPGATLMFGQRARIKNFSEGERMKIRLHMLGGTVDFSGLPADDLRHFEFIYPENLAETTLELLGNPAHNEINFRWMAAEEGRCAVRLVDLQGRVVGADVFDQQKGWNYRVMPVAGAAAEVIILEVSAGGKHAVRKVVVE